MLTRAMRAEIRKFLTTRLWWGMAIAVALTSALFAVLMGVVLTMTNNPQAPVFDKDPAKLAVSTYTGGIQVGYLLLLTIGILTIGAEYRHQTLTSTFLAVPRRGTVMLAKVVSLLVIAVGYGLLSLVAAVAAGAVTLSLRGADPFPSADILRSLGLSLLVLAVWGLIGLGVGILINNQVAALLVGVGVAWLGEPLLALGLTLWDWGRVHLAPFLVTQASSAVLSGVSVQEGAGSGIPQLAWWVAALVLLGYAALFTVLGTLRTLRDDVL